MIHRVVGVGLGAALAVAVGCVSDGGGSEAGQDAGPGSGTGGAGHSGAGGKAGSSGKAGSGGGQGGNGGANPSCQNGLSNCDGVCVDLNTSIEKCGNCVTSCKSGQSCDQGKCKALPTTCPCPVESYCDSADNTCKSGCLKPADCSAGRTCDTKSRTCRAGAAGAGGGGASCDFGNDDPECNTCVSTVCGAQCAACSAVSDCPKLYDCVMACTTTECENGCVSSYPAGVDPLKAFMGADGCVGTNCAGPCSGGGGGSGGTSTGGSGGGSSTDIYESARQLCLELENDYRHKAGVSTQYDLVRNKAKETCTDKEARDDAASGVLHGPPQCGEYYQNGCIGFYGTPESVITDCIAMHYAEGPSSTLNHYMIMTSTDVSKISCGFADLGGGQFRATLDFYW